MKKRKSFDPVPVSAIWYVMFTLVLCKFELYLIPIAHPNLLIMMLPCDMCIIHMFPPKTECGCLHGGAVENGRTRILLTIWGTNNNKAMFCSHVLFS